MTALTILNLVLMTVSAFGQGAPAKPFDSRIIGGQDAVPYKYPFMALVVLNNGVGCGGTLIESDTVLTAAHCCYCDEDNITMNVYLNLWNAGLVDAQCTEIRTVTSRKCHPEYVKNVGDHDHDVCLLTLNQSSVYLPAIVYDATRTDLFDPEFPFDSVGQETILLGYGKTTNDATKPASRLQEGRITIVAMDQCYPAYNGSFDQSKILCGQSSPTDACVGDSGGPLLVQMDTTPPRYALVGTVAAGHDPCATAAFPGLYVKLNTASIRNFLPASKAPTSQPTSQPSAAPTGRPTQSPSFAPTVRPSTSRPTRRPTLQPTLRPTRRPTDQPTLRPTKAPTTAPSRKPTNAPTVRQTKSPTNRPTRRPTNEPTTTKRPTNEPTRRPTKAPTDTPTRRPTNFPTTKPTRLPSLMPTSKPTRFPTFVPSRRPSSAPTDRPTRQPTRVPTTRQPTRVPTTRAPTTPAKCFG